MPQASYGKDPEEQQRWWSGAPRAFLKSRVQALVAEDLAAGARHGANCREDTPSVLNHVYVAEVESNHCLLFSAQKYLPDGGLRFSGFGISF